MSEIFNLLDCELERHERGHLNRSLGSELDVRLASVGVFELAPGESGADYHFELTREEWLVVVSGAVTLRTPEGERVLGPGDTVAFTPGPEGAHAMRNDGNVPARYAMLSTKEGSRATVYPERGQVAVVGPGFRRMLELGEP